MYIFQVCISAAIGGSDIKQVAWNILAPVFSDSVAKQMNWKGVNGKRSFATMAMKTMETFISQVQYGKNPIVQNAMDEQVAKHSPGWFNLASDRGGGRKARSTKSHAGQE
ncbi:hypothetical protein HHUSO_G21544 [Huso huso]|uniref:DUF4806 domain-containing protein n=1 Tax=Huso huso TaxID=61971 RepID=A0ABR0YZ73_HUSHU